MCQQAGFSLFSGFHLGVVKIRHHPRPDPANPSPGAGYAARKVPAGDFKSPFKGPFSPFFRPFRPFSGPKGRFDPRESRSEGSFSHFNREKGHSEGEKSRSDPLESHLEGEKGHLDPRESRLDRAKSPGEGPFRASKRLISMSEREIKSPAGVFNGPQGPIGSGQLSSRAPDGSTAATGRPTSALARPLSCLIPPTSTPARHAF